MARKRNYRSLFIKIVAILIVISMIITGLAFLFQAM